MVVEFSEWVAHGGLLDADSTINALRYPLAEAEPS
jgi:hypothetical protein